MGFKNLQFLIKYEHRGPLDFLIPSLLHKIKKTNIISPKIKNLKGLGGVVDIAAWSYTPGGRNSTIVWAKVDGHRSFNNALSNFLARNLSPSLILLQLRRLPTYG